MDGGRFLQVLRRVWPLALVLLLITLAGTAYEAKKPGPYQAASEVVLLPSSQISKPFGGNPYLSFQPALGVTADLIIREVMDPRTVQALAAQGDTGSYQVVPDPLTAGPVIDITVIDRSKTVVDSTLLAVTNEVSVKLGQLQAGMKPADKIASLTISYDTTASLDLSKKIRPLVEVIVAGLVLSLAITLAVDAAWTRRRPRRRKPEKSPAEDTSDLSLRV
jgi:hypothetical protein